MGILGSSLSGFVSLKIGIEFLGSAEGQRHQPRVQEERAVVAEHSWNERLSLASKAFSDLTWWAYLCGVILELTEVFEPP